MLLNHRLHLMWN